MVLASQIVPGMIVSLAKKVYRVEQMAKASGASKAAQFIKCKLRDLDSDEVIEKNFKPTQELEEVKLQEHKLEFLYLEGRASVFLDTATLELVRVADTVIGSKLHFLKEGIEVKALCYKTAAFSIELPQFLELMVSSMESDDRSGKFGRGARVATLETGAKIEVPPFIDVGDIVKIDPKTEEYIQRV